MRAIVTRTVATMEVAEIPEPGSPGPGEAIVRPEAVGICGSDIHLFHGHLGDPKLAASLFPRIQGHEIAAVVEQVGPDCPPGLVPGERVAVWPLIACGACYPCRRGRQNACANIRLLGISVDGGLTERLRVPASQLFPVGALGAGAAALVEPLSIALRTVNRGRVAAGERIAVVGAGPIGQLVAFLALRRGAEVLLLDRLDFRLAFGALLGADVLGVAEGADLVELMHRWAGPDGPDVVVEATGVPAVLRAALEAVAPTGRVVVAGISHLDAALPVGLFTAKEVDVLGVSCCNREEFEQAVQVVASAPGELTTLITHEFPLERTPDAIRLTADHPGEVMKAVIRLDT